MPYGTLTPTAGAPAGGPKAGAGEPAKLIPAATAAPMSADEANQSEEALGEFLVKGGCRVDNWDPDGLAQLGHELEKGEATLGRDEEGSVKRVVSVAKPVRPATYFLLLDLGLSLCRCSAGAHP